MRDFIDKTATVSGTPINREYMMALQGFDNATTTFPDGNVVKTNSKGETLTTTFSTDGTITETFVGEKTITKTYRFNADGSITEVVS